jgi:hypothetical protein
MNGNSSYTVIRAIRGPITLITLGALFALQNFTRFGFDQTWPVLLIVFGLLSLMQRSAAPPSPPRNFPPTGFAGSGFPPGGSAQPPRGYAQSPYAQTPGGAGNATAGSSKGGFGTSAPPRADSTESTPSSSEGGPA